MVSHPSVLKGDADATATVIATILRERNREGLLHPLSEERSRTPPTSLQRGYRIPLRLLREWWCDTHFLVRVLKAPFLKRERERVVTTTTFSKRM